MRINDAGLELLKSFEKCRLKAYQDIVGIWTIGWGSTGDLAYPGNEIDQTTADALLCEDLDRFEQGVTKMLQVQVNSDEFSALVCLAYNIGLANLKSSTLLKKLNAGDKKGAAAEFPKWNKAGGQVVGGLSRRRAAERALFERDSSCRRDNFDSHCK